MRGDLRQAFRSMRATLEGLMLHEESHLFPFCRALEQARERPEALRETVDDAIRVNLCEHEDARRCLLRTLELSQEFTPPAEACNSVLSTREPRGPPFPNRPASV